ncbi:hypothetical protein GF327_01075 [Candidatus Woesearchaeota archaeon]|nr:hypothetical protein [Candidatus Woesearchaeota archaeon]
MNTKIKTINFVKENIRLLLAGIIALILLNDFIVLITLFILLGFAGVYSLLATRMVPHISIESISASAILLGYIYNWQIAVLFALIFGAYGFIKISRLNLISITMILFMCLSGVLGNLFASLGYDTFWIAFVISFTIRSLLSFPVMQVVNPNMVKNFTHAVGDWMFNVFVTIHFIRLIYQVLSALNLY